MKLLSSGARRNSGATQIFNKTPIITWDNKSKEVVLSVTRIPRGKGSFYNFQIALTTSELQGIIGSITK